MNAAIRLIAWTLAILVAALPVVAVLNGWIAADHWPIQRLRLTAEYERVSAEQVRGAVAPQLGRGFFATDLAQVREAVAALPWVQQVEVRKRWPDLIEIGLREHRAFARWGADRLLSDQGQLFTASGHESLQGLPQLEGPDARVADVVALHAQAQQILTGSGLAVEGVRLSARGSWTLTLRDGARIVIGRADPAPRLQRLVRVLPQLQARETRPFERIDLRYTNGFAVRWAEEPGIEEPGIGNGESGIDGTLPAAPPAAPTAEPPQAAFTNPESRIPNPGFPNHESRITNHGFSA
jgi:cell division protein FtsQ